MTLLGHRIFPAIALAVGFGAAVPSALAQDCAWYARKAIEQQKLNLDLKCGLSGPSWHTELGKHLTWCRDVAPQEWQRQAQARDQQIVRCRAK